MTKILPSHLKLEVEKAPTGLRNMVANPDGRLGGWGWLTTGASTMAGTTTTLNGVTGQKLVFTSAGTGGVIGSTINQVCTEWMPLNEGEGVAAAWLAGYAGGTTYSAWFEFGDAAGVPVAANSTSPTVTNLAASTTVNRQLGPFVAPAATRKVRLWFRTGTAASLRLILQKVTVARAALLSQLGTNRTNRVINPSSEQTPGAGITWAGVNAGVDRVAGGVSGSWATRVQCVSGGAGTTMGVRPGILAPISPGATYIGSVYFAAATTPRRVRLIIGWLTSANAVISSTDTGWQGGESTSAYLRLAHIATAPANAYYARMTLEWENPATGEYHYADAALFELGNTVQPYFDGDTTPPAGYTNAWATSGSSAQTSSTLAYAEPITWLDIVMSAGTIGVDRAALDVGLLTATVRDATLDPATSNALRTGRKVRLTANGQTVATGEVRDAPVEYDKPKTPGAEAVGTITLTAVDNGSRLAQHPAPTGVSAVADLPHVVEGAGVPWRILGSDSQVPVPAQLFTNDNANALDQVVVTTNTRRAYAYVSRDGVLVVNAAPPASGVTLSDVANPSYVDAKVGLSVDDTVNSITVNWIGLSGGETVTDTFGPYEDLDSIQANGKHAETYTIQGEDAVAVWAQQTLAANKTPVVKVRSLRFFVDQLEDIPTALAMELTHTVGIRWQGVTYTGRVQSVSHRIVARPDPVRPVQWHVDVTFAVPATIPLPTSVPTP